MLFLLIAGAVLAGCSRPQLDRSGMNPKATATPAATTTSDPRPGPLDPSPTPTPLPACMDSQGQLERVVFPDPVQSSKVIPVNVYLPPCYLAPGLRYPVVYLLHGYPQDEDHWLDLGLLEVIENQQAGDERPAFIAVMPLQPEPYFTHTDGGPGSWEAVMLDGLVPYIDANYPTQDDPGSRALLGISRGGVWALEIGLRNPQVFDTVGALSPALIVNHPRPSYDPARIVREAEQLPRNLWLSTGDAEPSFRQGVDQFAAVLDQEGISYTYYEYPGRHEDAAWATVLQPVLAFVLDRW